MATTTSSAAGAAAAPPPPPPLKLKACDRCASIKQVCDREAGSSSPCSRCTRLELPCAITRVHKPMGRPRKNRLQSNNKEPPVIASQQLQESSLSPISEDDLSRRSSSVEDSESPPGCENMQLVRRVANTRVKRVSRTRSGCITCKARRKKCDEALPVCGDCARLGFICQRPPLGPSTSTVIAKAGKQPRRVSITHCSRTSPPISKPRFNNAAAVPSEFIPPPMGTLRLYDGCTPEEQHLLQHYTHVVCRSLSVVPDEINSFIHLFVPMAMQQPAMRNALLGLSATHLKRLHYAFETVAVEYQNRAMKQAQQLLRVGTDEATMEGLAAVLFLCLQEVCEGKSKKWQLHLEAAGTIINNRGGPGSYPESVRFLVESVAYFDAIATLSFSKSAFLDQQFYVPDPHSQLPAHALFGTAHALYAIIADISQLAQVRNIRYNSPVGDYNFRTMAAELELQLQEWTPAPCASVTSDPNLPHKVTAAGIMLQWAALMRLHLIVEDDFDITHPKVRVAVSNILAALDTIPKGDLVESMLIFPMFTAGFGALGDEQRTKIRERFGVMERSIGFGNVFDAHAAVERHWARLDAGGYNVGVGQGGNAGGLTWEEIVEETGLTLIMS